MLNLRLKKAGPAGRAAFSLFYKAPSSHAYPLRGQMAKVRPGVRRFTNGVWPSGLNVAPASSLPLGFRRPQIRQRVLLLLYSCIIRVRENAVHDGCWRIPKRCHREARTAYPLLDSGDQDAASPRAKTTPNEFGNRHYAPKGHHHE